MQGCCSLTVSGFSAFSNKTSHYTVSPAVHAHAWPLGGGALDDPALDLKHAAGEELKPVGEEGGSTDMRDLLQAF